jgi:hypothetical protein
LKATKIELSAQTPTEEAESSDEEIEKTIQKVSLETSGVKRIHQALFQNDVCHITKFTHISEIHITYYS